MTDEHITSQETVSPGEEAMELSLSPQYLSKYIGQNRV